MILDKLLEKKDVKTYIVFRKKVLRKELTKIKKYPVKDRESMRLKVLGRISELDELNRKINHIKPMSKLYFEKGGEDGKRK